MQLLAYETIEHHALLSRDNACPKSHVLVNELSESFTSYPNLQKLPKELTPLKPHFAKWSKPLIRIMKLKRKTNQLFDDYFKSTLKS